MLLFLPRSRLGVDHRIRSALDLALVLNLDSVFAARLCTISIVLILRYPWSRLAVKLSVKSQICQSIGHSRMVIKMLKSNINQSSSSSFQFRNEIGWTINYFGIILFVFCLTFNRTGTVCFWLFFLGLILTFSLWFEYFQFFIFVFCEISNRRDFKHLSWFYSYATLLSNNLW